MIDREKRKKLAFYLRQLATGQISNDDFEDLVVDNITNGRLPEHYYHSKPCKNDDKIIKISLEFAWCLYNDTFNHKLTGKYKLTDEQMTFISRLILFLHSDKEYDWSDVDITNPILKLSFQDVLKNIITLGQHYRNTMANRKQEFEHMKKEGDLNYWPFKNKQDYDKQLEAYPFLVLSENNV